MALIIKLGSVVKLSAELGIYTGDGLSLRARDDGRVQAGGSLVWARMLELVEAAPAAVARALEGLPDGFPMHVATSIADGVAKQAQTFQRALAPV